jgi:hypothetical protein
MSESDETLHDSIARQRAQLAAVLLEPLRRLAAECSEVWPDRRALDERLMAALGYVPYCKFLYALDTQAVQISDNISHEGLIERDFGRDRSARPYMNEAVPSAGFLLSDAYISVRVRRPSLTAIQIVRNGSGKVLGFVGADFDLRSLPLTRELYREPTHWRQIKGDPAIRSMVFHNTRVESRMDRHMEEVIGVLEELIVDHGAFHVTLHFSSSRATIWLFDDPYRYRLLDIDALIDPDTCLAYPRRDYPADAQIPEARIRPILEGFQELRFMDEMLYLRSSSVNIFNGMLRLTFSCDGSHYIAFEEFLDRGHAFWAAGSPAA